MYCKGKQTEEMVNMFNVTNGFNQMGVLVNKKGQWQLVKVNGQVWKTFATATQAKNYIRPMGLMLVEAE